MRALILLLAVMLFSSSAMATTKYIVANGATVEVDEFSNCKNVTNNTGYSMMVPTNSAAEWHTGGASFLENLPTGVTVSACGGGACSPADQQTLTSSGTWTKPSCGTTVTVECWGGGGGANWSGGGGGAYENKAISIASLPSAVAVTIGSGGSGGNSIASAPGGVGGNSSFGAYVTAAGGNGAGGAPGGAGSGGSGGNSSLSPGGTGGNGYGGSSTYGGGGGGSYTAANGGSSTYGGGGGGAGSNGFIGLTCPR